MSAKDICWLHISDWHQGKPDTDRKIVCRALIDDIEARGKIAPQLEPLDFLIFSGDLANWGLKSEFEAAWQTLLDPACKAAGLPPNRVFIVPGNHDLDRSRFDLLPCAVTRPIDSRSAILPWLDDDEKRARLLDPFRDYCDFLKTHLPHQQPWASTCVFEVNGLRIGIAGLNSSPDVQSSRRSPSVQYPREPGPTANRRRSGCFLAITYPENQTWAKVAGQSKYPCPRAPNTYSRLSIGTAIRSGSECLNRRRSASFLGDSRIRKTRGLQTPIAGIAHAERPLRGARPRHRCRSAGGASHPPGAVRR